MERRKEGREEFLHLLDLELLQGRVGTTSYSFLYPQWLVHRSVHACVLSHFSCVPLCNLWTVAHQAPLSMRFSRHEYWSGLPFPPPGDLPNPGIEPMCPVSPALAGGFFTTEPPGKPSRAQRNSPVLSNTTPVTTLSFPSSFFLAAFLWLLQNVL